MKTAVVWDTCSNLGFEYWCWCCCCCCWRQHRLRLNYNNNMLRQDDDDTIELEIQFHGIFWPFSTDPCFVCKISLVAMQLHNFHISLNWIPSCRKWHAESEYGFALGNKITFVRPPPLLHHSKLYPLSPSSTWGITSSLFPPSTKFKKW